MKKKGMTQTDLADAMGVSRVTISSWKKNKFAPGNDDKIEQLCKVLDVEDPESIFLVEASPAEVSLSSGGGWKTEMLAVMLALSKFEDVLSAAGAVLPEDERTRLLGNTALLRKEISKIYNSVDK